MMRGLGLLAGNIGSRTLRAVSFAVVVLIGTWGVSPATASPITTSVTFSVSGFTDVTSAIPVPTITSNISGSFTATFDPTQSYDDDTADITVNSFTGTTVGSALGFSYNPTLHQFFFGGIETGAADIAAGTDDFLLTLDMTNPTDPTLLSCNAPDIGCGTATGNAAFDVSGYTSAAVDTATWLIGAQQSSVPEPASLTLLGTGLFALGAVLRRRRGA